MVIVPVCAFIGTYIIGILTRPDGMGISEVINLINEPMITLRTDSDSFLGTISIWISLGGVLGAVIYLFTVPKKKKGNLFLNIDANQP